MYFMCCTEGNFSCAQCKQRSRPRSRLSIWNVFDPMFKLKIRISRTSTFVINRPTPPSCSLFFFLPLLLSDPSIVRLSVTQWQCSQNLTNHETALYVYNSISTLAQGPKEKISPPLPFRPVMFPYFATYFPSGNMPLNLLEQATPSPLYYIALRWHCCIVFDRLSFLTPSILQSTGKNPCHPPPLTATTTRLCRQRQLFLFSEYCFCCIFLRPCILMRRTSWRHIYIYILFFFDSLSYFLLLLMMKSMRAMEQGRQNDANEKWQGRKRAPDFQTIIKTDSAPAFSFTYPISSVDNRSCILCFMFTPVIPRSFHYRKGSFFEPFLLHPWPLFILPRFSSTFSYLHQLLSDQKRVSEGVRCCKDPGKIIPNIRSVGVERRLSFSSSSFSHILPPRLFYPTDHFFLQSTTCTFLGWWKRIVHPRLRALTYYTIPRLIQM